MRDCLARAATLFSLPHITNIPSRSMEDWWFATTTQASGLCSRSVSPLTWWIIFTHVKKFQKFYSSTSKVLRDESNALTQPSSPAQGARRVESSTWLQERRLWHCKVAQGREGSSRSSWMSAIGSRHRTGERILLRLTFPFILFLPNLETELEPGLGIVEIWHWQEERHRQ